jgi:hypothetical protein
LSERTLANPAGSGHEAVQKAADERTLVVETVGSVCWLAMDAAWMLGDIWGLPALLTAAKALCATATALLIVAFS